MALERYFHRAFANGALSLVYAIVAYSSLWLFATVNASASPVWPPTGLAIASLILFGSELWPGVFIGAFSANLLRAGTPLTSAAIATGNTLEALVGFYLVNRFAKGVQVFDRARTVVVFAFMVGFVAPFVSATIGVTSLATAGFVPWTQYRAVWNTWWLGDSSGAMTVAPLILTTVRLPRPAPPGGRREVALLTAALVFACLTVFAPQAGPPRPPIPLGFTIVPIIVWAGLRFGSRGASWATSLFSVAAVWGTLQGLGPFTTGDANTSLLSLQYSVIIVSTMGLALGALVHERVDAENAARIARSAELRFQTLVESAPDAVVISDSDGRIQQVNSRTESLFGYGRDELLQLKVDDLVSKRLGMTDKDYQDKSSARTELELFGRKKDGHKFPVETSSSNLRIDTGDMVSSTIRDITERKAREAELEASRRQLELTEKLASLGKMVSGIGHEVRTPLTYINTNLEIIKMHIERMKNEHVIPPEMSETLNRLLLKGQEGVERADKIIQQMRQFALSPLNPESYQLDKVVTGAVELFRSVHKGEVSVEADLQPVSRFEVDKNQIQQVIINLMNNGAEAMGDRGTLRVRLRETSAMAMIDVEDTGPGIPRELQQRLFDPFFTTKAEGTGLGLSISRRIIQAHGGTIHFITSSTGTTFTVYLPKKQNNLELTSP